MRRIGLLVVASLAAVALAAEYYAADGERVDGHYILKLEERVGAMLTDQTNRLASLLAKYDDSVEAWSLNEKIFPLIAAAEIAISKPENLAALMGETDVLYVEEVRVFKAIGFERLRRQTTTSVWGVDRVNQRNLPLDGAALSETDMAASSSVDVYVLDSGVDVSHPGFEGRAEQVWSAYPSHSDGSGHGTHVAGTVTSRSYGVSRAKVCSVRVLDDGGSGTTATVAAGMLWVASNHDRTRRSVASLSLGAPGSSPTIADAANLLLSSGVPIFAAAGNDNSDACLYSPASIQNAFTVGSSGTNDYRSSFSNYGRCVDIFAPGESIASLAPGGRVATMYGTSMSTPHVSAAAAIYLGKNPGTTVAQLYQALRDQATVGVVRGLDSTTVNRLLYVPAGGLSVSSTTSVPASTYTSAPPSTAFPTVPTTTVQVTVPPTSSTTYWQTSTQVDFPSTTPYWLTTSRYVPPTTTQLTSKRTTQPTYVPVPTTRFSDSYRETPTSSPYPTRCRKNYCYSRDNAVVTTQWCQDFDGCVYFPTFCYCRL